MITAARIVYIDYVDKALGARQLSRPTTRIWQRTYSPFAICKNVQPLILMEFTTAHLQFVKSTSQLLARTTINDFKPPLKTELKKIPAF